MRVVLALPSRLEKAVFGRLERLPAVPGRELVRFCSDQPSPLPQLGSGDALLLFQPGNLEAARKTSQACQAAGIHYGEAAVCESPLAEQFGFMLATAGTRADLLALGDVLDALSPCPKGWWHVGHSGAAAFLTGLASAYATAMQKPLDLAQPLQRVVEKAMTQLACCQQAGEYLALSHDETFEPAFPERQFQLAAITDPVESPARQIASLICLLAPAGKPDHN